MLLGANSKSSYMRSGSSPCFSVQAMVGDRNRCTEKRVRDFHLWEGKMRKHLSHNEYNLIMVIGHPLLFNDLLFSIVPNSCCEYRVACLLDTSVLGLSTHFNAVWGALSVYGWMQKDLNMLQFLNKWVCYIIHKGALYLKEEAESTLIYEELI